MRLPTVALAGVFGLSCSGSARQVEIGPPPPKATRGVLAGPLCGPERCECRTPVTDAGVPEGTRKRFEIKLGPSPHELWITLPDHVLYKSPERAEMCFYVDLAPGIHPVSFRASNPDGVSAAFEIHELGSKTKSWYDTFRFNCGSPGACSFEALDDAKADYAKVERNLHDACGSTKIKGLAWDTGKAPDQLHPSELVVQLSLDVYKFAPWKTKGDPTCGHGGGRPPE